MTSKTPLTRSVETGEREAGLNRLLWTWLQYLGYAAIGTILIFARYKCDIVELLRKCIPRKICIFCVKTTVTATPTVHSTPAPTAPTEENNVDCTIKTANVKIRPNKMV